MEAAPHPPENFSPRRVPPEDLSQDAYLKPYLPVLDELRQAISGKRDRFGRLPEFALGHLYFGLHRIRQDGRDLWVLREWAPNAARIFLIGDCNGWEVRSGFQFQALEDGIFELRLESGVLTHGQHFALQVFWEGGGGRRLPSYTWRAVQDERTKMFSAQVWDPENRYTFRYRAEPLEGGPAPFAPIIYEAHVGMAQEFDNIGSYLQFKEHILPYIADLGYNTLQLMAVQEHPYYGSFGYHVSNLFAPSSRFGTPEELKELIDEAHRLGLRVIIDIVHSHHVRNEEEGLGNFAGLRSQYFYPGPRGVHELWDSYLYDLGKDQVLHYLLSNLHYWLTEYQLDGFRFDGVTSMLYSHHGMNQSFLSYQDYFSESLDRNSVVYLALANELIHEVNPDAFTVAEDVSGFPGLAAARERGGLGFDFRMAMGISDYWFQLLDLPDEDWDLGRLWWELNNARAEEKTISYVECHDQALVGGKSFIFQMIDKDMYFHMDQKTRTLCVDRGIALHKMARLLTLSTARYGYLNFMGNEFGHPEWIDFPRGGNGWSYQHCRRLWSLAYRDDLLYQGLRGFEKAIQKLARDHSLFEYAIDWVYLHHSDQVLAYRRGDCFFIFNFHPTLAYTDYRIPCPRNRYQILENTDRGRWGGYELLSDGQVFEVPESAEIFVYLPPRLAVVLEPII